MLSNALVEAALPCQDFDRAKAWYKEKLGLSPKDENPGGAYYTCADGSVFFLFPSMGKASGDHTQMGFTVDDLEAEVDELTKASVTFERYDYPELKTDAKGIVDLGDSKVAWFKDSEGNLIAVFERVT